MTDRSAAFDRDRRRLLRWSLLAGAAAWLPRRAGARHWDAVLSSRPHADAATFDRLADALAAAPTGDAPYTILVTRGRWREKIVIDRPNVHLVGEDRAGSILSHDTAAGMPRPDGGAWGTWGCASVIVRAPGFRASHLTIENAFDYVGNLAAPRFAAIGPNGAQAVALMLDAGADRSLFDDVDLVSHQDTLFVDSGRSLFRRCRIAGSVDFIFGGGNALFERCTLHSRFRPGKERQGYVAVPSTPRTQAHGLTFMGCRLTRDRRIPDSSVALGRAWRPGRTFTDGKYGDPNAVGAAAYLACWMDAHIDAAGWDAMSYAARDGNRVLLQPRDARLFEYASSGPGARRSPTRRRLDRDDAARRSPAMILDGWLPPPA